MGTKHTSRLSLAAQHLQKGSDLVGLVQLEHRDHVTCLHASASAKRLRMEAIFITIAQLIIRATKAVLMRRCYGCCYLQRTHARPPSHPTHLIYFLPNLSAFAYPLPILPKSRTTATWETAQQQYGSGCASGVLQTVTLCPPSCPPPLHTPYQATYSSNARSSGGCSYAS